MVYLMLNINNHLVLTLLLDRHVRNYGVQIFSSCYTYTLHSLFHNSITILIDVISINCES
jgi:hypothetical protein